MKLNQLLKNIPGCLIEGSDELVITNLCADSRNVTRGSLFVAKTGQSFDGSQFAVEAVEKGACAVLSESYNPNLDKVTQIIHPDIKQIEAQLAAEYYLRPSEKLFMVGITGTNGKTTTSFILKYLLDALKGTCGLIGTIEYIAGKSHYPAVRTTPDVIKNQQLLKEMLLHGCRSAVMEVTSHALSQGRVNQIHFDVAIYTNLSWDHLDYHETMENYCQAKNQLFRELGIYGKDEKSKWAVINQDCPWAAKIIDKCSASIFTYGIEQPADLRATNIGLSDGGTKVTLLYRTQIVNCFWPLVGRFNVYNCLAAIGTLLTQGIPLESIIEKMSQLPPVRGRLEPVKNALGLKIYVDYAHTDDALENVLSTLSELKKGRLITIFGCGGDRDTAKRPMMAKVCEKYSDLSIVTSDNPRSENPMAICEEIIKGFESQNSYLIELDRKTAIRRAILLANPDDLILIAGKGHETYQIFAHETVKFDDCLVAAEICSEIAQSKEA